ncbi:MAG: pirin family protein [Rhodospirillales bacterium]|nr:pirin family protein [Rhodospirillales bacterium]
MAPEHAPIEMLIPARRRSLGGFEVGRVLPYAQRRMVGPFVFFDHMGPVDFPQETPRAVDVRPHPHIGLATVTYLYAGEIMHRDSVASEQAIRPGEVNWMVAGRGITHSERFEKAHRQGDRVHGIQAWVALPAEQEETAPDFAHHEGADLPVWNERGVRARLIAGAAFGLRAKVHTHSPLFYAHLDMAAGARAALPGEYSERALYVVSGRIACAGQSHAGGTMLVLGRGHSDFTAEEPATVMVLGGEPVGERFLFWNFVSSSKARLEQAKADWRAGRMKLPDRDHDEFIPLPESPNG